MQAHMQTSTCTYTCMHAGMHIEAGTYTCMHSHTHKHKDTYMHTYLIWKPFCSVLSHRARILGQFLVR